MLQLIVSDYIALYSAMQTNKNAESQPHTIYQDNKKSNFEVRKNINRNN